MAHDLSKGMHWIGHPGSLLPIVDRGGESVSDDVEVKASAPSLGGGVRVRVSRGRPGRSWSLSIPTAHSDDVGHVRTLQSATLPPYQLVTAHAQVSNVLTPDRSVLRSLLSGSVSLAGAWPIADGGGWSTITGVNPAAEGGAEGLVRVGPCPIPPGWTGRKVTVTCKVATNLAAGAYVVLDWLDAAGAQVGTGVNGNAVTGMDALRRSTVTAAPPAGAVSCRLGIAYAEVLAEPQVTWTDEPIQEWSIGEGADRVVITGFSRDTTMAVPDQYALRRSNYSLSLMEPGAAT